MEIVYQLQGSEVRVPLAGDQVTIGRDPSNDVVVPWESVSRVHAVLTRDGAGWTLRDRNSRNGLWIAGRRVREARVTPGLTVLFGDFPLAFTPGTPSVILSRPMRLPSGPPEEDGLAVPVAEILKRMAAAESPGVAHGVAADELLVRLAQVGGLLFQPLPRLLDEILRLVFECVPAERGCVLLQETASGKLVPHAVRRKALTAPDAPLEISGKIVDKAFRERSAVLVLDAQSDPHFRDGDSVRMYGIRSAIAVPLWKDQEVLGVLYADSSLREFAFSEVHRNFLAALSNYAAVAIEQSRAVADLESERRIRSTLERYHSPGVVERILRGDDSSPGDVSERDVTIVFADFSGFTRRTENLAPRETAALLNERLSALTEVLFRHEGTLDKFMGDAVMGVFGAPFPQDDHADRAAIAAIEMQEAALQLQKDLAESERMPLRVGMHSGNVVAGDIGSPRRLEYTVIGMNVNLASRLESEVAKPGQIVLSDDTRRRLTRPFRLSPLGKRSLRGLSREVELFELLGRG